MLLGVGMGKRRTGKGFACVGLWSGAWEVKAKSWGEAEYEAELNEKLKSWGVSSDLLNKKQKL